jgi:hypothetical protein
MKRPLALLLLVAILPAPVLARPISSHRDLLPELPAAHEPAGGRTTLSNAFFGDTVSYGGTVWAADSMRWEAIRDSCWTFDSGVGSAFGPTGPNKPAGYHTLMEGWFGIDQTLNPLPYFRRSSTCAINGSFSFWAGVSLAEANALCFAAGQGYGNSWGMEIWKSFVVGPTGNAVLSYDYAADVEPGFDYAYALIDTSGNGTAPDVVLAVYSGTQSGTESINLVRGSSLRSSAGSVTLKFTMKSDGSYSDEDGLHATLCGALAVDDITLTGAIVDFSDFETGDDGWIPQVPTTGVGDFTNIVNRNTDLPPPTTFCACGVQDSVLVFYDELLGHPDYQDNIAASPWIDLKAGGDVGRPGKLMLYSVYAEMPLANYVFVQLRARWDPSVCPATGLITATPFRDQGVIFYYGEAPYCNAPGVAQLRDYSSVIETGAEQVQLGFGMISLCATAPFGVACTGVSNTTPWLDNISLGIFGPNTAPNLTILTFDFLQDNFATDGTLNPASHGRLDANTIKNGSTPGPGTILRDTLVARGDGGNTEVRFVFKVRPGPFSGPGIASQVGRWTPEPGLGSGWYSARMDTAEQGGLVSLPRGYMTTFHEADPGFQGTDRTGDPNDPNRLENEIIPDDILTPGSRVDYFIAARYLPPDPRNPAGTSWYVTPDTTGGSYAEVEILPSSTAGDSTWSCFLYVDHHHDREPGQQFIEEEGLRQSLGSGGSNAEGTRYDRYDVQTPSSGMLSFGRPIETNYGATIIQAFAYKMIAWHSASLSSVQLTDEDANILGPWLTLRGVGNNRFWGSGDGLARSMNSSNEPSTVNFLRNVLGALWTCNTIRDAACPTGSLLDSTYCLPLAPVAGSHFTSAFPMSARGNGCPDLRSFDLLTRNGSVATSKGQLNYTKNGGPVNFASVTNHNTLDVDYRTVLDGFGIGTVRGLSGDPHAAASCADPVRSYERTDQIVDWMATSLRCRVTGTTAVPDSGNPEAPKYRLTLGNAHPNPTRARAVIPFVLPAGGGKVTIELFDVTGRLVKTLVDAPMPEGLHQVAWDGFDGRGRDVSGGLYFYRLTTAGETFARKLVVLK